MDSPPADINRLLELGWKPDYMLDGGVKKMLDIQGLSKVSVHV